MNLNLFLWFTSCDWFCKFCEKWNNLIYFWNQNFDYVNDNLDFLYIESVSEFENIINNDYNNYKTINISWYEPLNFSKLYDFILILKNKNKKPLFILKTSWLTIIDKKFYEIFDKVELSIYWNDEFSHNLIVWNNKSWELLNINLNNCINYWYINKIYFQTILIKSNYLFLLDIIKLWSNYNNNPFKIIYPRFIPKNNILELIWKKQAIKYILKEIPDIYFKNIIINNFLINPKLSKHFYEVTI